MEDIEGLALIQVNALDLNIEDRIGPDILIIFVLNVAGQPFFAFGLDLGQLFLKGSIVFIGHEFRQSGRRLTPLVPNRIVDEGCQFRIGFNEPAAMRNAVSLIGKALRETGVELMERRILQDLRVDFGDAVDAVTAEDRQVSHVNLTVPQNSYVTGLIFIARIAAADFLQPAVIDFFDN